MKRFYFNLSPQNLHSPKFIWADTAEQLRFVSENFPDALSVPRAYVESVLKDIPGKCVPLFYHLHLDSSPLKQIPHSKHIFDFEK